ncbi:MAG: arsenate reductase ArsC [Pseudomonadota bacterium]
MNKDKQTILYLCTGNSCRSLMAEAWTRHLKSHVLIPWSAGTKPGAVNPMAVSVMEEAGVDMSFSVSKHVDTMMGMSFDFVVTVCDNANENCPYFPGKTRRIHKSFDDPPALARGLDNTAALDTYRRVRDEIRSFVEGMPENL